MDIEKICRCCLALSGPLLSIYDGVSDMLREVTMLKPQQNDNMPANVCLSCISEINRCYVFKIKCENSNKTLRQLIPNALKEHFDSAPVEKVSQCDAGVQTENKSISILTREVQTDLKLFNAKVATTQTDFEEETNRDNLGRPSSSEDLIYENEGDDTILKGQCSRSPTKEEIVFEEDTHQIISSSLEDETKEPEETYIVLESINNESNSSDDKHLFIQAAGEHRKDAIEDKNCSSSSGHFEYYDEIEEETDENNEMKSSHLKGNNFLCNDIVHESINNDDESHTKNSIGNEGTTDCRELPSVSPSKILRSSTKSREQYKCSRCIMTFVSLKVLKRHLAKRHSIADATIIVDDGAAAEVPIIKNSFKARTQANEQVELTKQNVPKPQLLPRGRHISAKVPEQPQFKYHCEYCKAGFAQRKTLQYHIKQNICQNINFKCNQCDRIFISLHNLESHQASHEDHKCLECNKVCSSVEDLSEHMIEEHNRNARNQCHVCKKVFTMKASLMDHLRIHSGEKPFLCTVCGKSFRQNSNLRQHLMRHTNEKNFKCDMCPNAYVTKAELFSHQRTHTGDHPFKCEICSTCFTSSSSLLKHQRKHTGERPYACEFCPQRFAALNVLKNHRRTHTGERPYKCSFCDKCFSQKGDCLLHQRIHEYGEVKCYCGSKFSKISNLRQHVKSKHPNMTDEKRREMNETLNNKRAYSESGTELHITLLEDDDDMEEDEESHFVTISNIGDTNYINSQQTEVDNAESTDIIMEDLS